jgi:hypothetical protein
MFRLSIRSFRNHEQSSYIQSHFHIHQKLRVSIERVLQSHEHIFLLHRLLLLY